MAGNNQPFVIGSEGDIADVGGRGESQQLELTPIELENEGLVPLFGAKEQVQPIVTEFEPVVSRIRVVVAVRDLLEESEVQPIMLIHIDDVVMFGEIGA